MAEPQIQYARTSDGVSIAYSVEGSGPPLVYMPSMPLSFESELQIDECRQWFARLAAERTLFLYDGRGTGASLRSARDFSLDGLVRDLEAVVDALGLTQFDVIGAFHTAGAALLYSSRNPGRVGRLALWRPYVRADDWFTLPHVRAINALEKQDWETLTETLAHTIAGWSEGPRARRLAQLIRESITSDVWQGFLEAQAAYDVEAALPLVTCPTLVVHRRDLSQPPAASVRGVAAGVAGSRLAMLDGSLPSIYLGDSLAMDAVASFLGLEVRPVGARTPPAIRTVLFTDIVGHTEMMARLGDARGRDVLREHERITRETLKAHGGAEVKTMGDGFMASFGSVTSAVECAVSLQRKFSGDGGKMDDGGWKIEERVSIRVGLNAGEPIEEDGDLFGATVILASRIAAKAGAGEILVPDTVRGLLSGKQLLFADRGEFVPKGFDDAVRLYEVQWREDG